MAKLAASEAAWQAANAAVMTLGSYGYSREYPVEKWLRDAKLEEIYEGTSDIQRLIIARSMFPRDRLRSCLRRVRPRRRADRPTTRRRRSPAAGRSAAPRRPRSLRRASEIACCTTPHIASRKSDIRRISPRRARWRSSDLAERMARAARSSRVGVEVVVHGEVPEVEERIAHARVLVVDDPRVVAVAQEVRVQQVVVARRERRRVRPRGAASIRAREGVRVVVGGRRLHAPRLRGRARTSSTMRKTLNEDGTGGHAWNARSDRTTEPRTSSRRRSAIGTCAPSTNRATKHPDSGRSATTGGPTPASAARVAARASFARSIPSSSVSAPARGARSARPRA